VYSFGVVLHELLTRQRPYADQDVPVFLLMVNIGNGTLSLPELPSEVATSGLIELTEHCLAFSAADRPDFREVLSQLEGEYRGLRAAQQRQPRQQQAAAPLTQQQQQAPAGAQQQQHGQPGQRESPGRLAYVQNVYRLHACTCTAILQPYCTFSHVHSINDCHGSMNFITAQHVVQCAYSPARLFCLLLPQLFCAVTRLPLWQCNSHHVQWPTAALTLLAHQRCSRQQAALGLGEQCCRKQQWQQQGRAAAALVKLQQGLTACCVRTCTW
jgi:hypothetical protein